MFHRVRADISSESDWLRQMMEERFSSQQERLDYLQESLDAEVEARYSMDESFDGAFTAVNKCLNSHNEGLASLGTLLVGVEKKLRDEFEAERAAKDAQIATLEAKVAALEANNAPRSFRGYQRPGGAGAAGGRVRRRAGVGDGVTDRRRRKKR